MMGVVGIFHGTDAERDALNAALMANCTCGNPPGSTCAAHLMLHDTRVLDHLLFVRRRVAAFKASEFQTGTECE